jgi:hypothetical protein
MGGQFATSRSRRTRLGTFWAFGLCLTAPATSAADPSFGPHDVPTVFFINKSDDKNRVDYGLRLDARCAPTMDDAVLPYWREFEKAPPVVTHGIGMLDKMAYGIATQRVVRRDPQGGEHFMRLKQVGRPIGIASRRDASGRCTATARTTIAGVTASLTSIFVKLNGPLSVAYIDIKGKDMRTGKPVVERLKP